MNVLHHLIEAVATQANVPLRRWEIEPKELAQIGYSDALEQLEVSVESADRPQLRRFFADKYALILADLGPNLQAGRKIWLLVQAEVALLRASLAPGRNEDFMLMLVTNPGADREPEWIALAAEIERNDRVCRKLVWLPPASVDKTNESVQSFLGRSFLARPWLNESPEVRPALDTAKNQSQLLGDWEAILDENLLREPDYIMLIRALIEKESK